MRDIAHMKIWKDNDSDTASDSQLRAAPIDHLDLTNRPMNCLKRAGCRTIGDVLKLMESEQGLKSARNLGDKSEAEIIQKVREYTEQFQQNASSGSEGCPAAVNPFRGYLIKPRGKVWYTRPEDYGISPESLHTLHDSGIYYIADLYKPDFAVEPCWRTVRDLFASMIAKLG